VENRSPPRGRERAPHPALYSLRESTEFLALSFLPIVIEEGCIAGRGGGLWYTLLGYWGKGGKVSN